MYALIYKFLLSKFVTLQTYLKKNFVKKFIEKTQFSTRYSILFMSKKNENLRLCVDYRKLNEITIKDKTLLSNINEFQNRL